jgi:hypothetical protein
MPVVGGTMFLSLSMYREKPFENVIFVNERVTGIMSDQTVSQKTEQAPDSHSSVPKRVGTPDLAGGSCSKEVKEHQRYLEESISAHNQLTIS